MSTQSLWCLLIVSLITLNGAFKLPLPNFNWMCSVLITEFELKHYPWRVELHDKCVKDVIPKREPGFKECWKIMNIRDYELVKRMCKEKKPNYEDQFQKLAQCINDLALADDERKKFADCVFAGYENRVEKEKDWPPPES